MNWDTKAMRLAALPGAKRLVVSLVTGPITVDSPQWERVEAAEVARVLLSVNRDGTDGTKGTDVAKGTTVRAIADASQLYVRVEVSLLKDDSQQHAIEVYLAPLGGKDITYRFTVGPKADSKQEAANGFNNDPLDPRYGRFDPDWNGEWKYESRINADKQLWVAYLTIPFKTLGVATPTAGSFWRGNIGHTRVDAGDRIERSLWSANSSTKVMDDRNDFGELVFEAAKAGAAKSDVDATLSRMKALHQDRKWKELIELFGTEDVSSWPADMPDKASEAFHLRGQIYSFLKDGVKAEADLKAAIKLAPKNPAIWLTLADNYTNNLKDDEQALAAYRQAFAITGKGNGWQPLTATISMARLLTDQVKTDEALAVLKQYGDMEGMAPVWKIKMLRAYGHVYAAQGNEKESLAKFREALELESQSAAGR
ncbi:MAG: hypothetical protein FD138_1374 [Planctomycetota bacterium]|nr:MAG: hypothetical protein FD138_1374 [Planctomycetota bacterium]